jgi:general secretion pathway protein N
MMQAAAQRLPTLLLAAFAAWAFGVVIVVYAGLGGRYSLHPDDPSRVPELPKLDLSRAQNPLQPLEAYAVVGERPLFNADRRPLPAPEAPAGEGDAPPVSVPLDIVLTSVIMSGEMKLAIVLDKKANKSQSVRVGSSLEGEQAGWKLVELDARKAVFEGPSGRNEVDLRVFDGQGGEAPTPVASSAQAPADGATTDATAAQSAEPQTPESRAELIRRRIEERRRQMREEAERANKENQN